MSWESGGEKTNQLPITSRRKLQTLTLADVTAHALVSDAHALAFPETEEKEYGTAE